MKNYDTIFVLNPDITDEDITAIVDKVKDVITKGGGKVIRVDDWGKKKLTYLINKQSKGHYIFINYSSRPSLNIEVERNLKINDKVMRYITVLSKERIEDGKKFGEEREGSLMKESEIDA